MNLTELFVAIVVLFGVVLFVIRTWIKNLEQKSGLSDEVVEWLKSSTENFNSRLDNATHVIADLQKSVGEFSQIGRSMKDLQDFLQSPKLRGNIGEQILNDLLAQHFPPSSFMTQYTFKNNEKVDAVIKTSSALIPIDAKFPMENFRKMMNGKTDEEKLQFKREFVRDVKKHIQDISRKYILTDEGTSDYALMYIPSESIYYEIINDADLYDFSGSKRVLPVSPLSFYAYMKAILMSMEGQKIQERAKEILVVLQAMKKDYEKIDDSFSILSKHLANAYNQITNVNKTMSALGQKISSTTNLPESVPSIEDDNNHQT
jgi:DNA recombination protein RmuC